MSAGKKGEGVVVHTGYIEIINLAIRNQMLLTIIMLDITLCTSLHTVVIAFCK
jgi:hypothetical protein